MRICIIRHGDPDYAKDSLTEKGWKEAACLAEKLSNMKMDFIYVSPLGRAKDTASLTLKRIKREAKECQWLREFAPIVKKPHLPTSSKVAWDWLPADWTKEEEFFRRDLWYTQETMQQADVKAEYDWVIGEFDQLLNKHGYVRDGEFYRAEQPNQDTLVFFCHFGLGCVLMSRLMNVSPMILWHHTCLAPTSVTTFYTEERQKGIASFRAQSIGDISHLYAAGEEPAFAARFCEVYEGP